MCRSVAFGAHQRKTKNGGRRERERDREITLREDYREVLLGHGDGVTGLAVNYRNGGALGVVSNERLDPRRYPRAMNEKQSIAREREREERESTPVSLPADQPILQSIGVL